MFFFYKAINLNVFNNINIELYIFLNIILFSKICLRNKFNILFLNSYLSVSIKRYSLKIATIINNKYY